MRTLKRLQQDENLRLLRQHPRFQSLSPAGLLFVHGRLLERTYQPGETIFSEGSPGVCLFMVKSGEVEVFSEHRDDQRETVYTTVTEGELFGEMSVVTMTFRSLSARGGEQGAQLLTLSSYDLDHLNETYPRDGLKLLKGIMDTVAQNLLDANARCRRLQQEIRMLRKRLQDANARE